MGITIFNFYFPISTLVGFALFGVCLWVFLRDRPEESEPSPARQRLTWALVVVTAAVWIWDSVWFVMEVDPADVLYLPLH